jgi:hypothetical protein
MQTYIHVSSGTRTHDSSVREGDHNSCLRMRGHCGTSSYLPDNNRPNTTRGTASTSNIEIPESFQSKALRVIVDAPWYVLNTVIRRDLQIPTVKEEIRRTSK